MDCGQHSEQEAAIPDAEDLGRMLDPHRDRLRRMVAMRVDPRIRGRISPSDVIQETFVDAVRRIQEFRASRSMPLHLWLRFLAGQKILELERRHLGAQMRDARREVSLGGARFPSASSESIADALLARISSPSHTVARQERADGLRAALDRMSATDREILVMRHFEQLTNDDVAVVLGLSKGGASLRYMRAAKRLKGALDSMGIEPSGTGE